MPSPFHNRRALHVPFFPAPPPSASSPFPKYPSASSSSSSSSSSSASQPQQGFFPTYLAPPPPALPIFPANLSSLIFPTSRSAPPRRSPATHLLLLPALLLPLLALALAVAFFLRRIRPARGFDARSDSVRLFQPTISDSKCSASSEFLYLGTLVDSRGHQNHPLSSSADASLQVAPSPELSKTGSPELRPLPPLSRQIPQGYGNADGGSSPAEEFYSPKVASSSGNASPPAIVEKCGSAISTVSSISATLLSPSPPTIPSTPTIPSPPFGLSPSNSSGRSLKTMTERNLASVGVEFLYPPLPSPPPLRPMTPSPPKRKPASLPSPFSAKKKEFDGKLKTFDFSHPNPVESLYDNDFTHRHFATNAPSASPQRQLPIPPLPPPPPPPPPPQPSRPFCFRDGPVRKLKDLQRPDLVPDKKVRNPSALEESSKNAKDEETPRPKLKPLLWDKVRASSDRTMVWDQLRSSSFQVNEEMIETLFIRNVTSTAMEEMNKRRILSPLTQENRVLDPKKSQNIAILLRALNVTKEEVCEALLEGNADSLGTELLETLLKMAPNKEEEHKLKQFKEDSVIKLGSAEKFLRAVLEIPFAFKRVEAMLYITNFDSEVNFLKKSFETLEAACEELKSSKLFLKLLEAVLKTGNRMNVGTNRGDAHAFKLDTLLKLVDIKGTDQKTTLLHFVVQEITRAECSRLCGTKSLTAKTQTLQSNHECTKLGLQVVAGLGGELSNVKKAAAMDSDVLSGYVAKFAGGIGKITDVLRLNEASAQSGQHRRFNAAMTDFLKKTENKIVKLQDQESMALSLVQELTEYFHGDSVKEEAHPFRIFMVVRDFLVILDQVCKEVGRINEHGLVNSTRQHSVPIHSNLLQCPHALRQEISDE